MSRYVSDEAEERMVRNLYQSGAAKRRGGVEPCREMKWTGWEVIEDEAGQIYAIVVDQTGGFQCCEAIQENELHLYVEEET